MNKKFPTYYPRPLADKTLSTVRVEAWPFRYGYMYTVTGIDDEGKFQVGQHVHGIFAGIRALHIAMKMKRDYRY